jgi:glycosyltransferase involved in cell wall biosynthesis
MSSPSPSGESSVDEPLRVILDYRPALRARTGVGEYVHQLACALRQRYPDDVLTLFTSSWRDRPDPRLPHEAPGARVSDHRIPVHVLNYAWHNLEWPRVEWLVPGRHDVAFSPHPLLLPSRAAHVVMVHDVDFVRHPERTEREIRRDYRRLAADHARRADRIVVPSQYTADDVHRLLGAPRERIAVCPPGIPAWARSPAGFDRHGYLLFVGTMEPRKNMAGLMAVYGRLQAHSPNVPKLVLAGRPGPHGLAVLDALEPSLRGRVETLGYVADADRQRVYEGARALVMPSLEEGFGMPALEAMSLGIPVVASARGALPEVVGDAGLLVNPTDEEALLQALIRVLTDDDLATALSDRGRARASGFSWPATAGMVRRVFADAVRARLAPQ